MQFRVALLHAGHKLPVQQILGSSNSGVRATHTNDLPRPQSVMVVGEGDALMIIFVLHPFQLTSRLPGIRPSIVGERITDGIVGNGFPVIRGQLVLPGAGAIRIRDRLLQGSERTRSIRIPLFLQNIPAAVVHIDPRRACRPARLVVRIVDPRQLAETIIYVCRLNIIACLLRDVADIIIRIPEGHPTAVRDAGYQRGCGIRVILIIARRDEGIRRAKCRRRGKVVDISVRVCSRCSAGDR